MPLALFTDSTPLTPIRNLFNTIIQQLNKQEVVNYADLDALPSTAGLAEATRAHVDELNVDFQVQDGSWVQVGASRFASTAARDTAYAKASGAFRVVGVEALDTSTGITSRHNGTAWKGWSSDWAAYTPTIANIAVGTGGASTHKYMYRNGRVLVSGLVTLGSDGAVSGIPQVTLPANRATLKHAYQTFLGTVVAYDLSLTTPYYIGALTPNTDVTKAQIVPNASGAVATAISATVPFTWAAGDSLSWELEYEPA